MLQIGIPLRKFLNIIIEMFRVPAFELPLQRCRNALPQPTITNLTSLSLPQRVKPLRFLNSSGILR
jgi:hypothetical protein